MRIGVLIPTRGAVMKSARRPADGDEGLRDQVSGRAERRFTNRRITMADFVGTLEGNHLTYSDAISSTELAISGNHILGTSIETSSLLLRRQRPSRSGPHYFPPFAFQGVGQTMKRLP
jgi:hypothetical protein